jgi:hypothetical protein
MLSVSFLGIELRNCKDSLLYEQLGATKIPSNEMRNIYGHFRKHDFFTVDARLHDSHWNSGKEIKYH